VTRPAEFDREIQAVRRLLIDVSDQLTPPTIAFVEEFLQNDEPNEALLCIAWDLAPVRDELPERIVRFIHQTAVRSIDLPPAFRL
jgi:hypothetical protein